MYLFYWILKYLGTINLVYFNITYNTKVLKYIQVNYYNVSNNYLNIF